MLLLRIVLSMFIGISTYATAENANENILQEARSLVAQELSIFAEDINLNNLIATKKATNTFVCGRASGRRFLINMGAGYKKPIIERANSDDPVFDLAWNLQCKDMQASEALATFDRELNESICVAKNWNWREFGSRGIRIQGVSSCQSGRLLIKAYEGDRFLGYDSAQIEAGAFTIYVDNRPNGNSVRIEQAYSK